MGLSNSPLLMDSPVVPSLGARLSYNGQLGSVRYVGPVDGAAGLWLGIEWDDPTRGKHNGSKDNKFYFACRFPTAGSFIRPSKNISYGVSFLDALMSKYVEAPHGSASEEKVVLGSSQGAIEIQAVNLDKIRARLSNLSRLREASLDKEGVAAADPPGAIRRVCPNICGLDLSTNLLPSWDAVALISVELSSLERLALNRSRLLPPSNKNVMESSFLGLTELQINGTLITWKEMQTITAFMPQLRSVEMGYNQIDNLSSDPDKPPSNSSIQVLNLDNNLCSDWVHICSSLQPYKLLGRVILTSNAISVIPFPGPTDMQLYQIKHLSLTSNFLSEWTDIDAVSLWFPALETLSLSGNPLMGGGIQSPTSISPESTSPDHNFGMHSRPFVIARIPSLLTLDGTAISVKERTDSELFYISHALKSRAASEVERCRMFRQWDALCKKHGSRDEPSTRDFASDKLSNRLIDLELYRCSERPSDRGGVDKLLRSTQAVHLRVLPSLSMRHLRARIGKVTKHKSSSGPIICWLRMTDGTLAELKFKDDCRDLDWMGLESGSQIIYRSE